MASPPADRPIALLLVPRTVERFILYDQGQDLLRAPGVVAVEAPKIPYGALGRLPRWLGDALGSAQAARLKVPGRPVAAMMFHPFQWPFARAVLARWPECQLWYGLFDRTPAAPDASPRTRARLEELHAEASVRADLVFAVSGTHLPFFPVWLKAIGIDATWIGIIIALPPLTRLTTLPYATAFAQGHVSDALRPYVAAARRAAEFGLAVNAGHDLNRDNLPDFLAAIPFTAEVSIAA